MKNTRDNVTRCMAERSKAVQDLRAATGAAVLAAVRGDQAAYDATATAERIAHERMENSDKALRAALSAAVRTSGDTVPVRHTVRRSDGSLIAVSIPE